MVYLRKVLGVLTFACAVGASTHAQMATVVEKRPGGELKEWDNCRIIDDAYTGVKAKKRPFKAHQVMEIQWKQAPSAYKKGLNQFKDGSYAKAAQSLLEALAKPGKYTWLPVYGHYYLGRCCVKLKRGEEALGAFQQVLKLDSKHRFVPDIHARIADLYMSPTGGRNTKAARSALQKLKSIATRLDESYMLRADLGLARVDIMTKNAPRALNALDSLAARARTNAALQDLVTMERGRAHVVLKQHKEAAGFFKRILDSKTASDPEVIAGAANGLGDCEWQQGDYSKAMWTYSRTYALFYDRDDLDSQVAWALFRGGLSFRLHAGSVQGDERKKYYRYGTKVLRRAAKEYKGTQGGRLAATELGLATGN